MRLAASLCLTFAVLLSGASGARAQLDLPLADYAGTLKVAITCRDGTVTKFKTKGSVSIDAQAGANIMASAEFVGKRAGVDCTMTVQFTGKVNTIGRVLGTCTSTIACADGTTTLGSGDFDGRYVPGRLSFLIEGLDEDCGLTASFTGKGSPGSALCAALTHGAIAKLAKQYYSGWSKSFMLAHIATTVPALQAAITKIQAAFAAATAKIVTKVEKADGTCSKPPTAPSLVTAKLQAETIDPMKAGFQKSRPLDRLARSKMAKLQGAYLVARLKVETEYTLKLDPLKRTAALEKARDKFVDGSTKLLTKVTGLGLVWTGASPQAMATDIDDLVDFLVAFYE